MKPFQILVSNIGTVYDGSNWMQANAAFNRYVRKSKANEGRAAGETVTAMHNGDIKREYYGTLSQS